MKIIIFNSYLERLKLEEFIQRTDVEIVHFQTAMTYHPSLAVVHYVTVVYRELELASVDFPEGAGSPLSEGLR